MIGNYHKIARRLKLALLPNGQDLNANIKRFVKNNRNTQVSKRPVDFEKKIEILMPCYNHADFLPQAVESIIAQTWKQHPITITCINDHSTDQTAQVIQRLVKKHQSRSVRFQVITNDSNLRQDGSLNKAIASSQNELFIIVNDDDALVPYALDLMIKTFQEHPEVFMLGGSSIWFEGSLPKAPVKTSPRFTIYSQRNALDFHELNDINMTQTSNAFFKQVWKAAGGYRKKSARLTPDINEDRDFQMRVAALAPVGVYTDYPTAYWRTDSSHGKGY